MMLTIFTKSCQIHSDAAVHLPYLGLEITSEQCKEPPDWSVQ